jgi:hypothetical protein
MLAPKQFGRLTHDNIAQDSITYKRVRRGDFRRAKRLVGAARAIGKEQVFITVSERSDERLSRL